MKNFSRKFFKSIDQYDSNSDSDSNENLDSHVKKSRPKNRSRNASTRRFVDIGIEHLRRFEYTKAIKNFQKAWETKPKESLLRELNIYKLIGNCFKGLKKYKEAIECYKRELSLNPLCDETFDKLGDCYRLLLDYKSAIKMYQSAINIDPNEAGYYQGIGMCLRLSKDYIEAIKVYTKALEIDSNIHGCYYGIGMCYSYLKEYENAIMCFRKAFEIKSSTLYLREIGNCLCKQKKYKEAIEQYEIAAKIEPKNANILEDIGDCYITQEKYEKSTEYYTKAFKLKPSSFGLRKIGNSFRGKGDYVRAIEIYRKAFENDKSSYMSCYYIGSCYRRLGYQKSLTIANSIAIKWLKKGIDIYPKDDDIHEQLGLSYAKIHDYKNALECFKNCLKINGNYDRHLCNYAYCLLKLKKILEAKSILDKVNEKDKDDCFYMTLGLFHYQNDDFHNAILNFEKALKIDSNFDFISYWMGKSYMKMKKFSKAEKCFIKVLELNSHDFRYYDDIKNCLKELEEQNNPEELQKSNKEVELMKEKMKKKNEKIKELEAKLTKIQTESKQNEGILVNKLKEIDSKNVELKKHNSRLKEKLKKYEKNLLNTKIIQIPIKDIKWDPSKLKGTGGTSKVYKASWNFKTIALKVMGLDLDHDLVKKKIHTEIKLMKHVTHPLVVKVFGYTKISNLEIGVVLEYVNGVDLHKIIEKSKLEGGRKLSILEKWYIIRKMVESVEFLHIKGVRHRDIKPDNFMISNDLKEVKIGDFGMAKMKESTTTKNIDVQGTERFMAPETLDYAKTSFASDIFSLGYSIYEVADERRPFYKYREKNALNKTTNGRRPKFKKDTPIEFKQIFKMCTQHNSNERATASQIIGFIQSKEFDFFMKHGKNQTDSILNLDCFVGKVGIKTKKAECISCLTYLRCYITECSHYICGGCVAQELEVLKNEVIGKKIKSITIRCGCKKIISLKWIIGLVLESNNVDALKTIKDIEKVLYFIQCKYCKVYNDKRLITRDSVYSKCNNNDCGINLCTSCHHQFNVNKNKCTNILCEMSGSKYDTLKIFKHVFYPFIFSERSDPGKIPKCRICPECGELVYRYNRKNGLDCKHVKCTGKCGKEFCFICLEVGKNPWKEDDGEIKYKYKCGEPYDYCKLKGLQTRK